MSPEPAERHPAQTTQMVLSSLLPVSLSSVAELVSSKALHTALTLWPSVCHHGRASHYSRFGRLEILGGVMTECHGG